MKLKYSKISLSLLALMTAVSAQQALAAGFQINEMSPSLQGEALAGAAAVTNDPSAMSFNPATLATDQDTQVYLGSSYIIPHISYDNATGSWGGNSVQGITSQPSIAPAAFVPDGYFATTLPHNLHLGLAITAPWGLSTEYSPVWVGAANAIDSSISTVNIAPTIAWQVDQYLSLGAALDVQSMSVGYTTGFHYFNPAPGELNTDLSGNSWGFGYSAGALVSPTASTNVGLGYRSQIVQNITGTATASTASGSVSGPAEAHITIPQVIDFGITQQVTPKLMEMATIQWTGWSSMQNLTAYLNDNANTVLIDTPLDWGNSWLFSVGAQYQLTQAWVLRAGTAFDGTPTNDKYRTPNIPDTNRYWLALGAGYTPVQNITLNMAYEHIFMTPQSVNVTQDIFGPVNASVQSNYSGHADILAGSVNWTF